VTEEPLAAPADPVTTAPATVPVPPADARQGAEPAAPAPATPTSGRLLVRSTPTNAMVVIDGVWSGRTPFTKTDMTFGRHTVRVVLDGYEPINRTVTFSAADPSQQMTFELTRARRAPERPAPAAAASVTGTMSIASRPAGARVFVDDRPAGTTPVKLEGVAAGTRRVRIELAGFRPWVTTVEVVRSQDARVAASLERQ
jgi:hypothetical protein